MSKRVLALAAAAFFGFVLAQTKPAFAVYAEAQSENVRVIVTVGVYGCALATGSGSKFSGPVAAVVGGATQYMKLSTRTVAMSAAAGATVSVNCAVTLTNLEAGLPIRAYPVGGFVSDFHDYARALSFSSQGVYLNNQSRTAPYWVQADYLHNGGIFPSLLAPGWEILETNCIGVRVKVPPAAKPGVYESELTFILYCPVDGCEGAGTVSSPTPSPSPTPTPIPTPTGGHVFVSFGNYAGNNAVVEAFDPNANGNVAPQYTITNSALTCPSGVITDASGNVLVANAACSGGQAAIYVFAPGPNPSMLGSLQLGGTALTSTPAYLALDATGDIFAGDTNTQTIQEFVANSWLGGASGAPIATLAAGATTQIIDIGGLAVSGNGTLYVANGSTNPSGTPPAAGSVLVFAPGASGSVAPISVITGPTSGTKIGNPQSVRVDGQGRIFVLTTDNGGNERVMVFAAGASGAATPIATIEGPNTQFTAPIAPGRNGMWVDVAGGVFVENNGNSTATKSILYFAPGSTGNVAPTSVISSNSISLPYGFAGLGM